MAARETIWTSQGETGWSNVMKDRRVEDFKHGGLWRIHYDLRERPTF